ncbi:conserved hypothetical protein [Aeromonas salmonicida]|nr:conserved hypothetical protein [Aeromonas salmonicida]
MAWPPSVKCHQSVTRLGLYTPCGRIFSHVTKKTKNSKQEKRFLFFQVTYLSLNDSFYGWLGFFINHSHLFLKD